MAESVANNQKYDEIIIGETLNEEFEELCQQFMKDFHRYDPWEVSPQSVIIVSKGYWDNIEVTEREVRDWCEKHGLVEGVNYFFQ